MNLTRLAVFVLLSTLFAAAFGEPPKEIALQELIGERLGETNKVESVTQTPYLGLFEVRLESGEYLYTDIEAKYVFAGHVFNSITHEDYTKTKIDAANMIQFADLPLAFAIKTVKGDGRRIIATFEDPNCGYCKKFRRDLQSVDNITVYTFLYNILNDDSASKSKKIWCGNNPSKAWDDWMTKGVLPPESKLTDCATDPNEQVLALGKKLHIEGTPTIFFVDGSRVPGVLNKMILEEKLAKINKLPTTR